MTDGERTKAQLIEDLADAHRRIADLEAAGSDRADAEETLRKAEPEKDAILNSLVEHVIHQDTENRILWANRAACESAGLAREDLIGRCCYEVWHERSDPCPDCPVIGAVETGQPQEVETTTPDGRAWFIRGYPIRDASGDVTGAVEVTMEITKRKRAEEAMRRSLEETAHSRRLLLALSQAAEAMQRVRTPDAVYRAIGEHALAVGFDATIFTLSDDRTQLTVSYLTLKSNLLHAAEKLTGLSAEGYCFPLTPDSTLQRVVDGGETVYSHLDTGPFADALPRLLRPLAERLANLIGWQQSIIAPLSTGGEVLGLLSVTGADLTESDVPAITAFANQAAIALENTRLYRETQQLASFNKSIVQSMTEGLVVQDADGRFTFANPAVATLLGYAPEELVGLHWTSVVPVDHQLEVREADERRRRGQTDRYALELVRKDGRRVAVLLSSTPRFDAEGNFDGTVAVLTDITELKQAEEALQLTQFSIDRAADAAFWMTSDAHFFYVNDVACSSLGYSREELLSMTVHDIDPSFPEEIWPEHWREVKRRGSFTAESHHRTKTGRIFPIEITVNYLEYKGREYNCAFAHDITERQQAEKALEASEEKLRMMIDNSPIGFSATDLKGNYIDVNPALCSMVGYSHEEMMYKHFDEFSHPESRARNAELYEKLVEGRIPYFDLEKRYIHRSGRIVHVLIRAQLVRDSEGKPLFEFAIVEDITEQKKVEEERARLLAQIRGQASQIQQTIDTVPEGVVLLDARGRVILANPVAEGDLAVLADAEKGDILRPDSGQVITHLGDRPLAELLTSPPTKGLWHEVKAGGRIFEVIARPMQNGPEPEKWVLVIRDVTQERESERRNQQQEQLVAVGQLAAGIAHDFNNIMAVIVLYIQLGLRLPDIPTQLRERLQVVDQQAKRATDLIEQILDFSRRAVMERRPMDLTLFLKEMVRLLERTVPESIKLEFTYGRDEYTVNADPTRVQQAVMNLVVNARDAMLPKGGGKLEIELDRLQVARHQEPPLPEMEAGIWVRVRVTDTGEGIPPDVLPHIYEPFYTTKEVGKGTGLGLAQVYGIVKQHEGHIDVTTEVGAGTTFTLYLPALLEHQPEAPAPETRAVIQGLGETVLVVEDNADLRNALAMSLELLGYRVVEAADGREALDILEQGGGEISLVLSDLVMPEMGGAALFHAMQQRGLTLPMVMLSGHPMEREMESLREEGLAGWMLKPPDMAQLSQLLARALSEAGE